MAEKIKKALPLITTLILIVLVAFITIRFKNIEYLSSLFIVPIIIAGYSYSTTMSVVLSIFCGVFLFAVSSPLSASSIVGLVIQSILFIAVGLTSGITSNILKAQRENISIHRNQLLSLHRVSSNFITTLEPAAVVDQLTRESRRLLATDASMLAKAEPTETLMIAEENLNPKIIPQLIPKLPALIKKVENSPDPTIIHSEDVSLDLPFKSIVVAPVSEQRFLFLFSVKKRNFTEDELNLLANFLDEATIAMSGASYYEAKERNARVMASLATLTRAASSLVDIEELRKIAVEKAIEISKSDNGVLLLLKKDRLLISQTTFVEESIKATLGSLISKLDGHTNLHLLQHTKDVKVFQVDEDNALGLEHAISIAFMKAASAKMAVYLPLTIKNRVAGIIILLYNKKTKLPREEIEILNNASAEISLVLYNSKLLNDIKGLTFKTIESLASALDATNPYTKDHSRKVALIASGIARELGMTPKEIKEIQYASLLHDFGKIFIPDNIFNSPRKLTQEELEKIRELPIMSSKIFERVNFFSSILPLILKHKERFDGNGYPFKLKGEEIPIGARIISLSEAYVAMTADRSFRNMLTHEEAMREIIENSGKQFDPKVVNAFMRFIEKMPSIETLKHKTASLN